MDFCPPADVKLMLSTTRQRKSKSNYAVFSAFPHICIVKSFGSSTTRQRNLCPVRNIPSHFHSRIQNLKLDIYALQLLEIHQRKQNTLILQHFERIYRVFYLLISAVFHQIGRSHLFRIRMKPSHITLTLDKESSSRSTVK